METTEKTLFDVLDRQGEALGKLADELAAVKNAAKTSDDILTKHAAEVTERITRHYEILAAQQQQINTLAAILRGDREVLQAIADKLNIQTVPAPTVN